MRIAFVGFGRVALAALATALSLQPGAFGQAPPSPFDVQKYDLAANQDVPELCFAFSGPLARQSSPPLESFVTTDPAAKVSASVKGDRLCLQGLGFGASYAIVLKAGLPGLMGALAKDMPFQVAIPDRPPEFDFASGGEVLPRIGSEGLPIRTVNVPKLAIDLFRITDRDLLDHKSRVALTGEALARFAPEQAERVWQGVLETKGAPNHDTVTALPIDSTIGALKPGLYVATAHLPDTPPSRIAGFMPTQYFVVSDLGLTAYRGPDNLLVAARSLATAAAAAGVDVALIGVNNRELARVRTDGAGFARFDSEPLHGIEGDRPAAIYAYGAAGEFSYFPLEVSAVRPLGNEIPRGPLRAMLSAERATYRAGETVHFTLLMRDEQGRASPKWPVTVKIARPDGVPFDTRILGDQGGGASVLGFDLPPAAQTGIWTVAAYTDPNAAPIGRAQVEVTPAFPPRLSVQLSAQSAVIDPAQSTMVDVQAQYADGPPAAGAPGEFSATVEATSDPFPAFSGFSFGLVQEASDPMPVGPVRFVTDAGGKASVPLKIAAPLTGTKPLEARISVKVFDVGGEPVTREVVAPIANQPLWIGVRTVGGPALPDGQPARFEIIALSPDGARQDKAGLAWEILREDSLPAWDWSKTRWVYKAKPSEKRVAAGVLDAAAATPVAIASSLPSGAYRLEVFDPKGAAASSLRFHVGWIGTAERGGVSDPVEIKPAKPVYAPGESAEIFVKPPFESDVTIVTADHALRNAFVQHIPAAGTVIHIDMPRDTAGGVTVIASAVAPAGTPAGPPRHARGSAWLAADPAQHRLDVQIDPPERAAPGQQLSLPVIVTGAGDEPAFVTVSAIDERALNDNSLPRPFDFFFGEQPSGISAHDIYGGVITAGGAAPVIVPAPATGGGEPPYTIGPAPPPSPNPATALYSGIVALDKSGKATIPIVIPDFTGKLKISAVAWSASRMGAAEASLPVHDPLVVDLALPPSLAPDDRADIGYGLDNRDGPRGEYKIAIAAEGPLTVTGDDALTVNLAEHEQRGQMISIQAHGPGDGAILLSVQGPGGIGFQRRIPLRIRSGGVTLARHASAILKPGAKLAVDPALLAGLRSDTATLSVALGGASGIDLRGVARELAIGNHGSAEQIASAAALRLLPQAQLQALGMAGYADSLPNETLHRAVIRVLGLQAGDGGFGLWNSTASRPWLTAYIVDFLSRARSAGEAVPDEPYRRALDYLADHADPRSVQDPNATAPPADFQARLEAASYASAILVRNGRMDLPQLRYFADRFVGQMRAPVSLGWVASAYAALGDKPSAATLFAKAAALSSPPVEADEFASDLRDQAALAALLAEAGATPPPALLAAAGKIGDLTAARRQLSTQEDAWIVRAAAALGRQGDAPKLKIGDKANDQPGTLTIEAKQGDAAGLPVIANISDKPVRAEMTVTGASNAAEPKDGGGFEIQRWLFDPAGKPVDPGAVHENDLLVVVLTGRFTGQGDSSPVVVDPLPAGWEIEAARIANPGNRFAWLKDLTAASYAADEAGRYVATPDLAGERREFKLAYVVRAMIRGQFLQPGAFVEDIYRPALFARTPNGRAKVDSPS